MSANGGLSDSYQFRNPDPSSATRVFGHPVMRAKMRVSNVQVFENGQERLSFSAVAKSDGYPADGSDEDNSYARWSPMGELSLTVANPALYGKFVIGDKFYLDFTPAGDA